MKLYHATTQKKAKQYRQSGAILAPVRGFTTMQAADDLEPLRAAGRMLLSGGFTVASHTLRCYVLCGWRGAGPSGKRCGRGWRRSRRR